MLFFVSATHILHPENRTYFKNMQNFDPHSDPQRVNLCVRMADNIMVLRGRNSYRNICFPSEKKPQLHRAQILPMAIEHCVSAGL